MYMYKKLLHGDDDKMINKCHMKTTTTKTFTGADIIYLK